jgi:KaiC/GvpD/RAD55 family RecA-like ATPase
MQYEAPLHNPQVKVVSRPVDNIVPPAAGLVDAALKLAERGKPVFPCKPSNKHPYTAHGFKDATTDEDIIRAWWRQYPDALIGMPTGAASGVVVVDLDRKNGVDGYDSWLDLQQQNSTAPDTYTATTQNNGFHLYYKHPGNGTVIKSSAGKLGPGIDIRGDGGYVIVPPSPGYEAEASTTKTKAPMPDWLIDNKATTPPADSNNIMAAVGGGFDVQKACADILGGSPLHDSCRGLAAHFMSTGVTAPAAISLIQSFMDNSAARKIRPQEWQERRANIPHLVITAAEKFAPADDAQPEDAGNRLTPVDLSDLATAQMEPPSFVVEPVIPRGFVSLFGGHGGSGKSILALTWCAHVACGMNWGPLRVERSRVLFVSLEDPGKLIRYRLRRICEQYSLPMHLVRENLLIKDGTDTNGLAFEKTENGIRRLIYTVAADEISEEAATADLVVIDNASDAFDANENERRLVRAFVRHLQRMVKGHDGAVLLLAHLDKTAARYGSSGNSYSGSTAWHNSTRSRVALIDGELVHEKLNVGKKLDDPIPVFWSELGVLVPDLEGDAKKQSEEAKNGADDAAVLACMRAAEEAGEIVSAAKSGPLTAWHTLRLFPECPDVLKDATGKTRVTEALLRLSRAADIERVEYRNEDRKQRKKWVLRQLRQ